MVGAVVVAVALLTALFGFGLRQDPTAVRSVLIGKRAPAFTLRTLDGSRAVSLNGLRGQVVVVNFWASWCAECRAEQPALEQAWQRYRDQGVVFLGISFQDESGPAVTFARQYAMRWPLLGDPGSRVAVDFGLSGVPETYVIAPNGAIAGAFKRAVSFADLSRSIAGAVPGGAP
jgi:cytochrome c biogenesis protein CcmG, thiol:disulfide interchange protein DsbE